MRHSATTEEVMAPGADGRRMPKGRSRQTPAFLARNKGRVQPEEDGISSFAWDNQAFPASLPLTQHVDRSVVTRAPASASRRHRLCLFLWRVFPSGKPDPPGGSPCALARSA